MPPVTTPPSLPLPLAGPAPALDPSVWYAQGLPFHCAQCANCCSGAPGYVWLTLDDMHRIASFLQLSLDDFTRAYVRKLGPRYALTEMFNYDCAFLTRAGMARPGCLVYPVRPMQCRTWPFWNENLKSPDAWKRAAAKCPGIRAPDAPRHALPHIEACRQHPESPA